MSQYYGACPIENLPVFKFQRLDCLLITHKFVWSTEGSTPWGNCFCIEFEFLNPGGWGEGGEVLRGKKDRDDCQKS